MSIAASRAEGKNAGTFHRWNQQVLVSTNDSAVFGVSLLIQLTQLPSPTATQWGTTPGTTLLKAGNVPEPSQMSLGPQAARPIYRNMLR
jgi:hypothetical protein